MSLGYLGCAKKSDEDEKAVIYTYGSVNWNETEHKNDERITDGIITINKSVLPAIEVVEKIKRLPGGKKTKIVKNKLDVNVFELIKNESIQIENTKNCWSMNADGVDTIAISLCNGIMNSYREKKVFPWNIEVFK